MVSSIFTVYCSTVGNVDGVEFVSARDPRAL